MSRLPIVSFLLVISACNFSLDPNRGGVPNDDEESSQEEDQITYTVNYRESNKTLSYLATKPGDQNAKFFAEEDAFVATPASEDNDVFTFVRTDVLPSDYLTTTLTFRRSEGDIRTELKIPRVSIDDVPQTVSRSKGFTMRLGGEPIAKSDFVDMELYDPETKKSITVISLQPDIPGTEGLVTIDGQTLEISPRFMQWFSEFESGKELLVGIGRSPGGWVKEGVSETLINYQVTYSSLQQKIIIEP